MLNITDKRVQELSGILNTTDDKKRTAAYAGVAMAYSNKVISKIVASGSRKVNAEDKMGILDLFYDLNEIAVIGKDEFTVLVAKFIDFKLNQMYGDVMINDFGDVSGVNVIFGSGVADIINGEISTLRASYSASKEVLELR